MLEHDVLVVGAGLASMRSKPGGRRSLASRPRAFTLRNSQDQLWPAAAPSVRANPVILETGTNSS